MDRPLLVCGLLKKAHHRSALVERPDTTIAQKKRRRVAGVGVGEGFGVSIVHGVEKRSVAIVRRVSEKVSVEPRDEISSVALVAERRDAAQGRLQARHQQGCEDSLAADISQS